MNHDNLGDALDHWKGDLISRLEGAGAVSNVHALPMFTDAPWNWNPPELDVYACLLHRVGPQSILLPGILFPTTPRADYFNQANRSWAGDVFVDPDTGIRHRGDGHYIRLDDIRILLDPNRLAAPDRIVMIYQHKPREYAIPAWRDRVAPLKVPLCLLWSGPAGAVFLSTNQSRIDKVRVFLTGLLGSAVAKHRLG